MVLGLVSEAREDAELEAIALARVGQKIGKNAGGRKELHGSHHLLQSGKQLASSVVSKVGLAQDASARFGARLKAMAPTRFGSGAGGLAKGIVVNPLHVGWSTFADQRAGEDQQFENPLAHQFGTGSKGLSGAAKAHLKDIYEHTQGPAPVPTPSASPGTRLLRKGKQLAAASTTRLAAAGTHLRGLAPSSQKVL